MGSYWNPPDTLTSPASISTAGDLVAERFNSASAYAAELWARAQTLLSQLGEANIDINWTAPTFDDVDPGGLSGINASQPTDPIIANIAVEDVAFSWAPPDAVVNTLPSRTAPEENFTDPGFAIPAPPSVVWPTLDATSPGVNDAVIPEAPTITLPSVPSLDSVSIPSPPEYSIPEFDWELPTDNLEAPEPQFVYNEAEYDSTLKQRLTTELYNNLVNGGSGLPEATEQAIYDRATSRMTEEEQLALDQMLDFFSGRGFDLPPGALAGQMLELNNKVLARREDLNNDILIQQSKLAQENTHFIIDRCIVFEKNLMDYTNEFQNRALDAAKYVVQSALVVFQTKVEAYKARLVVYQVQAEVYKARIQGEIAKADFYRAQIEGIKASVQAQAILIEAYKAQVAASTALVELYEAEMRAAQIRAQIDEIRIKNYATEVQAYSAEVAAASERYRGYQAQIAGEQAKADMYRAQVQAYAARVEAYRTEVQADTLVLQQDLAINENAIEIFKARVQQYLAQVEAATKEAQIEAANESLKIETFKAQSDQYIAQLDALYKAYIAAIEEVKARTDVEVKTADLEIREAIARQEIIQDNIKAAAQVASQLAAAAVAGVSASANIQHGESRSDSRAYSVQVSGISQSISSVSVINQHITNN